MTGEEYDRMLEAAKKQHQPRELMWKNSVLSIVANTPADAQYLVAPRLPALFKEIARCLAESRFDEGDRLSPSFQLELDKAIRHERQHGALRPVTAASEIARCIDAFAEFRWNGHEVDSVLTLMGDGRRIVKVDFDTVYLSDDTTITRADLREKLRPPSIFTSKWELNFTSPREIEEARQRKAEREMPQPPSSGPLDENGQPLQGGYAR